MAETAEPRSQQQALVASLHTALEALTACVESIYDLIEHVDAFTQAEDSHPHRRRTLVSYGGGLSPLASLDHSEYPSRALSPGAAAALADAAGIGHPMPPSGGAGTPDGHTVTSRDHTGTPAASGSGSGSAALMAATDLAHRGYTRDEIAERLRDRWGEEAGQILRDLME